MRRVLIPGGTSLIAAAAVVPPMSAQSAPVRIAETFDNQAQADLARTGAAWGGGDLRAGYGGGSGRLGDLRVPAGAIVVLSTDAEDFSGIGDPAVFDPKLVIDGAASANGGFFDFATVTVEPGGVLRFEGPNPARLHTRGLLELRGTMDASGGDAGAHDDAQPFGQMPPSGGPGGAMGGKGADQADGTAFAGIPGGGTAVPGAMLDGMSGGGIPEPNAIAPLTFVGGGMGGLHNPAHFPTDPTDIFGVCWDLLLLCSNKALGGVGGGGGYTFDGATGINGPLPGGSGPCPIASPSPGGFGVAITPAVRALLPERGLLRGGSGGGGGGSHLATTRTDGMLLFDCTATVGGGPATIIEYVPHSAAAGGGGGGAVEVVAGNRLLLEGRIDASGGTGGGVSGLTVHATAGGGGSGGAIRLLARQIQIAGTAGQLNVSGGEGGFSAGASTGGAGSPGLVRVESVHPAPDAAALAAVLAPDAATLASKWGGTVDDVLSTAAWKPELQGPAALSGAQSCWRSVAGTTSFLEFHADQPGALGWDMTLEVEGLGPVSWRGANPLLLISFEEAFGTDLASAPIVVRFQGARSAAPIANPCDVELHGAGAEIVPDSLTPWVRHPAELNLFTSDPAKKPDLVRFQVLFNRDQAFAGMLDAVLELGMLATPH